MSQCEGSVPKTSLTSDVSCQNIHSGPLELLTEGLQVWVPTTPSLDLTNLLEWLTELRETQVPVYYKGYHTWIRWRDTQARYKGRGTELPCPPWAPPSRNLHKFSHAETPRPSPPGPFMETPLGRRDWSTCRNVIGQKRRDPNPARPVRSDYFWPLRVVLFSPGYEAGGRREGEGQREILFSEVCFWGLRPWHYDNGYGS